MNSFFLTSLFLCVTLSLSLCPFLRQIRPGQFGYGRVPYSLPLHRQNRHTRYARLHGNTTTESQQVSHSIVATKEVESQREENEERADTKPKARQRPRSITRRAPPPASSPFSSPLHRPHPPPDTPLYAPPPYIPSTVVLVQQYRCSGKDTEIRKCTVEVRPLNCIWHKTFKHSPKFKFF